MRAAAALSRCLDKVTALGAGIVAARSARAAGHDGLAQRHGHRSTVGLLQDVTGSTRSDAAQRIRVGSALLEGADPSSADEPPEADSDGAASRTHAWHEPADRALLAGIISAAQHDSILRGLGEPSHDEDGDPTADDAAFAAWTLAAQHLVDESAQRTVEELASAARTLRDVLDPDGARRRFLERHEHRSFRMWTDRDGIHHSATTYDDEGFALVKTIHDAALRPRRGGPRFVDDAEQAAAKTLAADPRTNDQLAYDLMLDLLGAGARADTATVFGVKQAGVRLVQTIDHRGARGVALTEDGLVALPRDSAEQHICDSGTLLVTVDSRGNPLQVGRERRLFTPPQRIALAVRDGGCRWRNCDRPASYCEAHHIDEWAGGGRTDVERGILLCRFHHMQLHHGGWRITRDGEDDFVLHDPGGATVALPPRVVLRYAFADIDPPPRRFAAAG